MQYFPVDVLVERMISRVFSVALFKGVRKAKFFPSKWQILRSLKIECKKLEHEHHGHYFVSDTYLIQIFDRYFLTFFRFGTAFFCTAVVIKSDCSVTIISSRF